ncbi:MAG: WD40/YVTN/BNR-like repeat-containing protein, partial [Gammaproteobacteria bacterium]
DKTVFAGSPAGLFRSTDSGRTWQQLPVLADGASVSIVGLAMSPDFESDATVIVSVRGRGLHSSSNGGNSFQPAGTGLYAANVEPRYFEFSPGYASDGVIYAASDWSLWLSTDKGSTWSHVQRPVRYEDWRGDYEGLVRFTGDWQRESDARFSASTQTATEHQGAIAVLNFTGSEISWYGERGPRGGTARITIDGEGVGTVDLSAGQVSDGEMVFSIDDLEDSLHEIVVEVLGGRVTIDNFDVSQ